LSERENQETKKKKTKSKNNVLTDIFLLISIFVFVFSAFRTAQILLEYKQDADKYEQIANEFVEKIEVPTNNNKNESNTENADGTTEDNTEPVDTRPALKVDFDSLLSICKDVVGWIYFEEPKVINYPVVMGIDNKKYLRGGLDGKYSNPGTLFTDMTNAAGFIDKNTIIYGHNRKDRSMFGSLRNYRDPAYRDANPYFYMYTPDNREIKYEIFAVCVTTDGSESYQTQFADNKAFFEYIKRERQNALYKTDVEVTEDDLVVSLSTCTNRTDLERLIVHAVKVEERILNFEN
jgi:sortase B